MQRGGLDHTKMKKLIHENFVVAIRNLGGQGKQIAQIFDQCIERADKKVKYTIDQREQSTSNKLKKQKELDLKKEREKIDLKKDKDELKKLNNGITKQSISLKADTNFVRLQSDSEEEEDEEDEALMLAMALSMSTKKDNATTTTTATVPVPVQRQTTNDILLNTARDTLSANNSAKNDNLVAMAVEDKEEQEEKEQKEEKKQSHSRQNTASFLKTLATSAEQKEEEDNNKEKENKEKENKEKENKEKKEQEKENKEKKEQDEKKEKEEKKKVMINDTSEAWLSRCVSLFREPLDMDILNTVPTSTTSFINTLENIVTELNNANVLHLIEENEEEEKKEKKNNGETTTATATETTTATTASTTTSTKKFIQSTENQIASSILFEMRSNEETIQNKKNQKNQKNQNTNEEEEEEVSEFNDREIVQEQEKEKDQEQKQEIFRVVRPVSGRDPQRDASWSTSLLIDDKTRTLLRSGIFYQLKHFRTSATSSTLKYPKNILLSESYAPMLPPTDGRRLKNVNVLLKWNVPGNLSPLEKQEAETQAITSILNVCSDITTTDLASQLLYLFSGDVTKAVTWYISNGIDKLKDKIEEEEEKEAIALSKGENSTVQKQKNVLGELSTEKELFIIISLKEGKN